MSTCTAFPSQRLTPACSPSAFAVPGVRGAAQSKAMVGCKYCRNTTEKTRFLRKLDEFPQTQQLTLQR